tara:strand:+ start:903 stop:1448 length:546 start_codon:yes stop_codon:yes gene_type:complete
MKKEVQIGSILISKPFIEDKRFEKTIILIAEHNKNGTVGFIINQPTNLTIDELLPDLKDFSINIKKGGPVETNNLFFIHKYPDLIHNSIEIKNGFFWGGELQDIVKGYQNKEITNDQISFFLGYTGWEKNQLEEEINEGSWIISEINLTKFNEKINWSTLLIAINKEYEVWATAPADFHLN